MENETKSDEMAVRILKITLPVPGMENVRSAKMVGHSLKRLEGVQAMHINIAEQRIEVDYDSDKIDPEDILDAVERAVKESSEKESSEKSGAGEVRDIQLVMALTRPGYALVVAIAGLFGAVTALALATPYPDLLNLSIRLAGLYGLLLLGIATIITPFMRGIYRVFGRPFLKVHHFFAITGLVLSTLHPVLVAVHEMSLLIFLPTFASWEDFWRLGGRPAFILLYVGLFAALLRNSIPRYWRPIHGLMFVVLLLAVVHGNLIGTDFQNTGIAVIFNALFVAAVGAGIVKRWQRVQAGRKRRLESKS